MGEVRGLSPPKGICGHDNQTLTACIVHYSSAQLVTYSVSADGVLSPYIAGNILLPAVPWDLLFDWSDRLWVCLHQQPEPVLCYQWKDLRVNILIILYFTLIQFHIIIAGEGSTERECTSPVSLKVEIF